MPNVLISMQSQKALDVPGGSMENGVQIQQWDHVGGPNQQWEIIQVYDTGPHSEEYTGPFLIVNVQSSKALDDWYASTEDGNPIMQYRVHGGDNQRWYFKRVYPTGPAIFVIINKLSGKVLNVSGASLENGAKIIQYHEAGGLNEQWLLQ